MSLGIFPYPTPAELIDLGQFTSELEPIVLSEQSQLAVNQEATYIEEKIKDIQKIKLFTHTYYSLAYDDEQGKELFDLIYCNPDFYQSVATILESLGISEPNAESTKEAVEVWDLLWESIFEDVCEHIFKNEDNSVLALPKTTVLIKEKYAKDVPDGISISTQESQTELNINKIPEGVRRASNKWSAVRSRELFIKSFVESGGDITKVVNPTSNETLVNIDNFILKIDGYRELKARIKDFRRELHVRSLQIAELLDYEPTLGVEFNQELSLNGYLERLYSLYQEYINYKIAEMYKYAVIVAKKPVEERSEAETELLARFSLESEYIRSLEIIDKFLNGSPQLSEQLVAYGDNRKSEQDPRDESINEEYAKYNAFRLNPQKQSDLTKFYLDLVAKQYPDFPKITVEQVKGKQKTFSVVGTSKIKIPDVELGLVDFLSKISSEIEGHVFRKYMTKKYGHDYKYIAPRDPVLSEGHSNYVSGVTKQTISGVKRTSQPYYLTAIQTRKSGGSFKESYKSVFDLLITRRFGKSNMSDLSAAELETATSYAYTTTDRIFRRGTSYEDISKRITASDDLEYLRGEIVYEGLKELGIDGVATIDRVDLYSLQKLIELGLVDPFASNVQLALVATEFWPKIKSLIDSGVTVENIAPELRKIMHQE